MQALVLPKITGQLPSVFISPSANWSHLAGLQLADPSFSKPNKIDMLLGADIYGHILLDGLRKGISGAPIAQSTQLGWILSGQIDSNNQHAAASHSSNINSEVTKKKTINSFHYQAEIEQQLKAFWELEEMPNKRSYTKDELACENFF